jgi:uncharacterized membrane protein (UPF0127 family)
MERLKIRLLLAYGALATAVAAVVMVLSAGGSPGGRPGGDTVTVRVGGVPVRAIVAATAAAKARGLSGRATLPRGEGMLFVYDEARRLSFWMRGMRFALDMVWIRDGRVAGVTRGVPAPSASSGTPLYPSSGAVDHVLEVPAGWAVRHDVGAGAPVAISR